jgi:hypothetical protein
MQWKKLFRSIRESLANEPEKPTSSITINLGEEGLKISTNVDAGTERAMADILFNIANGYYVDDIYEDLHSKITEKQMNEIMIYLRSMSASQTGLENLYETSAMSQEKPFVSPCNVFSGMQNAEANNQL